MDKITFTLSLFLCLSLCSCSHTLSSKSNPKPPLQLSEAAQVTLTQMAQIDAENTPQNDGIPVEEVIDKDNLPRLQPLCRLGEGTFNYEFDLSSDGSLLAVSNSAGVLIYDILTGKQMHLIQTPAAIESVAFSADAKSLAAVYRLPKGFNSSDSSAAQDDLDNDTILSLWQVVDGSLIFKKNLSGSDCSALYTRQLSFNYDDTQLMLISSKKMKGRGEWQNLCVFSSQDGQLLLTHDLQRTNPAWSPTTYAKSIQKAATAFEKEITILNADWQEETRILADGTPFAMSFSPDGQHLAYAGDTEGDGGIQNGVHIVNLGDPQAHRFFEGARGMIITLVWSPDGKWIAGEYTQGLVVWDTDGEIAFQLDPIIVKDKLGMETPGIIPDLAFSPAGDILYGLINSSSAYASNEIRAWRIPDGKQVLQLWDRIGSVVAFSPDSQYVASGGYGDGRVQVWNVESCELAAEWETQQSLIRQTLYSPDGVSIITAGRDGSLGIWEAATGNQQGKWEGSDSDLLHITINKQGTLLASSSRDGKVIIRSFPSGNILQMLQPAPEGWIMGVLSFTADGENLLMGWNLFNQISGYRGQWGVWNSETNEIRAVANTWPVEAFNDGLGHTYVVWSDNGQVSFGQYLNDQFSSIIVLGSPRGNGGLEGYGLTPDGSILVSGSPFGLHAWNLPDAEPVIIPQTNMGGYPYGSMSFSPDGKYLAICNDSAPLTIWGVAP